MNPLLRKGLRKQIDDSDLSALLGLDRAKENGDELWATWQRERQGTEGSLSLWKAIGKVYGPSFCFVIPHRMAGDLLTFVSPLLLQQLLQLIENGEMAERGGMIDAVLLTLCILFCKLTESILIQNYFHQCFRVGWRVRTATATMVYRKIFRLSTRGLHLFKTGQLVDLVSIDAVRLCVAAGYLHYAWSAPMMAIIAIILLYNLLGSSVFAGLFIMIVLLPINTYVIKKMQLLNNKLMEAKDRRTESMDEVLHAIRVIKLFAWEDSFMDKVQKLREKEMLLLRTEGVWAVASSFVWIGSPLLVSLASFAAFTWSGNELKPHIAFTALSLFNVLRMPLFAIPQAINFFIACKTAIGRIHPFLCADEVDPCYFEEELGASDEEEKHPTVVSIKGGEFSWCKSKRTLHEIDFEVKQGEFVMICGSVGSGKTSLLAAILGGMLKKEGTVRLKGSVGYSPQEAWIMNATLRDNVLFGKELKLDVYDSVLKACSLDKDIEMLPGGDATEIGEKGINLSGGQKARIALARACYSQADLYLLDDPLSAVDVHVGNHIMSQCIGGLLAGKTRILVTHQVQYAGFADRVVFLEKGRIIAAGRPEEVRAAHSSWFQVKRKSGEDVDAADAKGDAGEGATAVDSEAGDEKETPPSKGAETKNSQTIQAEKREEGALKRKIWKAYANAMGLKMLIFLTSSYLISQALQSASDFWLSIWSSAVIASEPPASRRSHGLWLLLGSEHSLLEVTGEGRMAADSAYYLMVYSLLSLIAIVGIGARALVVNFAVIRAANRLHSRMLRCIVHSPVRFFDTTPMGRILNRFGADQYAADKEMRESLGQLLQTMMKVLQVIVVVMLVTPTFAVIFLLVVLVYYRIQRVYRQSSRELKRLESVSKSPLLANLRESMGGIDTIRAFKMQATFEETSDRCNDAYTRAYANSNTANRWLGVRLEFLGNMSVFFAALLAVLQSAQDRTSAGLIGLSITYALEVTHALNWFIRGFSQLETNLVSVERIDEYSVLETEPIDEEGTPQPAWPSSGAVEFDNVEMRYRPELELSLRGVTFAIGGGEKLGVVGRTGAGKSSLAVAIFRICELSSGRILIDGVDTSTMSLRELRSKLAIIPQDPVLFSGSIRYNVDPFQEYSDGEVWEALRKVHLDEYVRHSEGSEGLELQVASGGSSLSVGQRQLLCLARALMRRSKVMVMDEATANVDLKTDEEIQEIIRENLQGSTVITVAHRLNTVMKSDKILVMSAGKVGEIGDPGELIANEDSLFSRLCKDTKLNK
ncbi:hypothetical protein GUITHDRAFT_72771 [Guillardia theta CCMP2712]|uniref:Uncharacterized protein n=4 Tax=Guillardia theta TaxID=55529 RepID=L1J5V5_GUITC|nr:hypothetical protein GUITHDRAFT_72771 [Guillardia theta CCMP2712]EKX43712.1 hypothetical protein GUITHDRAFT_72771 [Guillardia theta CCMP2712]|eukprot:XP_005830692.1 hypothetical protein GUITHDRAFT_72771 [Guillardia theta CCMP2712]